MVVGEGGQEGDGKQEGVPLLEVPPQASLASTISLWALRNSLWGAVWARARTAS